MIDTTTCHATCHAVYHAAHNNNARSALAAKRAVDAILSQSPRHVAAYLSIKSGLARTKKGNVSVQKLARCLDVTQCDAETLLIDIRRVAAA